jgi:hypothetical protein
MYQGNSDAVEAPPEENQKRMGVFYLPGPYSVRVILELLF